MILNNRNSWFPCFEIHVIVLTEKGDKFIIEHAKNNIEKVNKRFSIKQLLLVLINGNN